MREIKLYEIEPIYEMGEVNNLLALGEKIKEDQEVLSQIQHDYDHNQEGYKKEYIPAKINHLKNQHLYYWFVLKKYFDDALVAKSFNSADYQKEEMKKRGWMLPQFFINSSLSATGGAPVTTEELYIRNIHRMFDYLFLFPIGETNSRIDRYYKQAISNYKNDNYYSCAVSLFPIIESYHQYMTNYSKNGFYRIKENLSKVNKSIETVNQIYNTKIEYYMDLVNQFNDLAENHYFCVSLDRENEPEIINRNRIMHGLFSREISQKDCLQLFCTLSNMVTIKNILNANEMMDKTAEELKELEQSNI